MRDNVKLQRKRRAVADKLAEFCLSGEDIKRKFKAGGFEGDAISLANEWSNSVRECFTANPNELGTARSLALRPRQADWFVFGQFDPLGQAGRQDERTYAFRHISIEMEKLVDVVGELLR